MPGPPSHISGPPGGGPPGGEVPIGLLLAQIGRAADQAFDEALSAVGGSRPAWLVLLAIISGAGTTQTELAERVGITGPTLVHHLDRLEAAGWVQRQTEPANRRVRTLALTPDGRDAFLRMREAAMSFDARLHQGISDSKVKTLRAVLAQLRTNLHDPKE